MAWGTGGHTDEFVRFADARTVLLTWPDDVDVAAHPVARLNRLRMQRNFDILAAATDAQGQPFRIVKLPLPRAVERRLRGLLQQAFAGRQIGFVDAIGANWVGGGPHCATLNEPRV